MKKVFVLLIFIMFISGCNSKSEENIDQVTKLMRENDYVIVDVRTNEEYKELHVKEAVNIPLDELNNFNIDKNRLIFVYCKSGNRSMEAKKYLTTLGYNVYDLGGIDNINLPKE